MSSPNAVVFVLAIANPLSNEKVFRANATQPRDVPSAARAAAIAPRSLGPLALVIELDWRILAGFSGYDGKRAAP
jgi:hypothetical protein